MVVGTGPWAHTVNEAGRRHLLEDHLRGTASLAGRFAGVFGAGDVAYRLGLLHDVGKAACAWQGGLLAAEGADRPVGIDHKRAGARLAISDHGLDFLAMAIQGHHGGLTGRQAFKAWLAGANKAETVCEADAIAALRNVLPELGELGRSQIPDAWLRDKLVAEMGLRMVFSALCDADFLDTAAHFADRAEPEVRPGADFVQLRDRFEKARAGMLVAREASAIDAIREEVYRECVAAAPSPRGVFRLGAPTGVGMCQVK